MGGRKGPLRSGRPSYVLWSVRACCWTLLKKKPTWTGLPLTRSWETLRGIFQDQDPILPLSLRRRDKFTIARVLIRADLSPRSFSRVVPLPLHNLSGNLVHLYVDRFPCRQIRNDESAVL